MQSKSSVQGLRSVKAFLWAAPVLIGALGLMAFRVSRSAPPIPAETLKTEAQSLIEEPKAAVEPQAPSSSTVQAKPLPTETPISAKPLTPSTNAVKADVLPAKPSSQPSLQKNASSTPTTPKQSALTMEKFSPVNAPDVPEIPIRVAIARKVTSLKLATSEEGIVTDGTGKVLGSFTPQQSTDVYARPGEIQLGSLRSTQALWVRTKADNGLVFVDGHWYRGIVQLVPQDGLVTAVNHVEMQPYLYSVVGAEMYHDWPLEALKAQAIAARSYALVHIVRPASRLYDLGNTQRWQAYKGVNSEASGPRNAVNQTRGIVISHNGGVVESLYASSAELVQDAHKGFGMSQYGARDLAQQSLSFRQILSRFYPGTELSLLQNKKL